jgi:hypothetical protein
MQATKRIDIDRFGPVANQANDTNPPVYETSDPSHSSSRIALYFVRA